MRNSRITSLFLSSAAFSLLFANPVAAQTKSTAVTPVDKDAGSRYVQCDGNPNNMTAGESAARLLGAVTLLALFAPPPESPDASKRKFGAEGVAVCSALIDGDAKEGNAKRRINLILARALHHIEARDYTAAITDTKLARSEADALGLTADPYFMKSRGYVFANIESAALLRMGQLQEAKNVALSNAELAPYSLSSQRFVNPFSRQVREMTPAEEAFYKRYAKLSAFGPSQFANRLEDNGRFADAAKYRAAIVAFNDGAGAEDNQIPTRPIAAAAISTALAGDWARANTYFNTAKENFEARKVAGKPDEEPSAIIEQFDLYSILERMRDNDMKTARRLFSARSQWTEVSFGNIMEVNRRLRIGAEPDELIGGLEKSPDQLWMDRANNDRAQIIAKDANNKELFWLIPVLNTSSE